MAVIEPCPFCDNAKMAFWEYEIIYPTVTQISVLCPHCGARGPKKDNIDDAIESWNKGVKG